MLYTIQQILNKVRVDEDGEALKVLETEQQAFNAVFDPEKKALRVNQSTTRLPDAVLSGAPVIIKLKDENGTPYYFKAYPIKS